LGSGEERDGGTRLAVDGQLVAADVDAVGLLTSQ
jgi:hypothetical protein